MKLNLKIVVIFTALLSILFFCTNNESHAAGVKIYVSTTGSDLNSGTKDLPLASLNGAVIKLRTLRNLQTLDGPV